MAITPLPPVPSRQDPTTFSDKADAFLGALPTFATEANALQSDVNSKQITASTAATTATTKAEIAATAAATATTKATEASSSASAAASSASTALTAVGNASSSASVAIASKDIAVSAAADAVSAASSANALVLGVATGYPTIRPSLNLDFANSGQFDPRITFTRNSTATYFGSDGLLKTASANEPRIDHDPVTGECKGFLVEEARTNLLTYSEQFDNAAWTKVNSSVTPNAVIAPDGTLTAYKVTESATTSIHEVYQATSVAASTVVTISAFFKAAERPRVRMAGYLSANWSTFPQAVFDLVGGVVVSGAGVIENIGGGWFKCSISGVTSASGTVNVGILFGPVLAGGTTSNYTGDGTSGIYIWGAQFEAGAFPTSYIPTPSTFTSRNSTATYFDSTGVMRTAAINEPRYDHGFVNGRWVSKGLVLEDSATNLVTYSEQFDNAAWTTKTAVTLSSGVLSPRGDLTAYTLTSTSTSAVLQQAITGTSGITYAGSVWIRRRSGSGTVALRVGETTNLPISVTDNWVRVSATNTPSTTSVRFGIVINTSGDSVDIWGAQLEADTQPTSYIKTEATSVTRAADLSTSSAVTRAADSAVMTGSNFSNWYRQDEGTIYSEWWLGLDKEGTCVYSINGSSTSNEIRLRYNASGTSNDTSVFVNGDSQASLSATSALNLNTLHKNAMAYKSDDFARSLNGESVIEDSSGMLPTVSAIHIGSRTIGSELINGHIKRLTYYPKRLPNAQLQALTQ